MKLGRIKITDTSLRDGHQSLWATRMTTEDMLPILENIDQVGYHSLEVWGGATFDVCIRYLNEDPWERLRKIRRRIKKTKLQMLLRGQSLVGYTHYPDDIVEKFVEKAAENGIDIFRVFDALNDMRNLETCMRAAKRSGKHVQACVVYTVSPVHSMQHFVDTALRLKDMGADSICIKDMAGLLSPYASFELVKALKENVDLPLQLHTHYIGGLAIAALIKAAEAGVDIIDTASVPMAFGSSQPPVETIVRALQDTPWDTGLDLHALFNIATHFEQIRKHKGFERGVTRIADMKVFEHQVPGGMITNLFSQLEEQKASHRIDEVLAEIPKVRADLGYPPLVTPTSQIISIQAVLNVLMGERYKLCPSEVKDYVRGYYGKPAVAIKDEIRKKIIGDEEVITVRPADLLEPAWERSRQELGELGESEEDILTYALFPQVALKFFKYRKNRGAEDIPQISSIDTLGEELLDEEIPVVITPVVSQVKKVAAHGGDDEMKLDEIRELILLMDQSSISELEVQKDDYRLSLRKANEQTADKCTTVAPVNLPPALSSETAKVERVNITEVLAPMVGTFYAAPSPDSPPYVQVGDHVGPGQTLCILEAMKLMNEIKTEFAGTIIEIMVDNAEAVEYGQVLFLIEKDQG
ncbi:MAG: acetyl-CoA carboxylase biotin carboxyl carrier protein [Syntrophomonas sp.]|uniref:acetyl-CoA carboxylase biotin carboxyl carrier protein n=1 Tax=Syntrophomonas sp. TaxID=2053627 RepID=UPI002613E81A|nr:acetyl-CoA carboxylase biotin carboxyl carrier protein [Syntrophomonas sp.]MDD2510246.1 acetyl-CoA carboxylase biotin carboxyl carrier protein [Syntrophomonas sp.]MDD3878804.1 acetyl-CoA carboxylase biotin carboxyl carrier protein [Syntrophomonas sp.]MDD4626830.1 acetyl-CoA carboxylase biotin carboxyl carrier protein [Syntrophomonas sp.]